MYPKMPLLLSLLVILSGKEPHLLDIHHHLMMFLPLPGLNVNSNNNSSNSNNSSSNSNNMNMHMPRQVDESKSDYPKFARLPRVAVNCRRRIALRVARC